MKKIEKLEEYLNTYPNNKGYFNNFGGKYISGKLLEAIEEVKAAYLFYREDLDFINELNDIRKYYQGRPTPVYFAKNLTEHVGGANIYFKREDLNFTGSHKLNHCMAEALLAKKMGKKKLIAETGAGQHGVALATACAYFKLECEIHMGEVDVLKQMSNVNKIKLLGGKVIVVKEGLKTLKEAVDSAFNSYLLDTKNSMFAIGSVVGPDPYPLMVRDFQMVIGKEAKEQFLSKYNKIPEALVACVGGGSNALGLFTNFLSDDSKLYGVEPLGKGSKLGDHAASITYGSEGVMHGFNSLMLKDEFGNPAKVHSVASGLDYPSIGPEHAYLSQIKRVEYRTINDKEAIDAFFLTSKMEGIIPALESSHAIAYAIKLAKEMGSGDILVNLSGRGDKDLEYITNNYKID